MAWFGRFVQRAQHPRVVYLATNNPALGALDDHKWMIPMDFHMGRNPSLVTSTLGLDFSGDISLVNLAISRSLAQQMFGHWKFGPEDPLRCEDESTASHCHGETCSFFDQYTIGFTMIYLNMDVWAQSARNTSRGWKQKRVRMNRIQTSRDGLNQQGMYIYSHEWWFLYGESSPFMARHFIYFQVSELLQFSQNTGRWTGIACWGHPQKRRGPRVRKWAPSSTITILMEITVLSR